MRKEINVSIVYVYYNTPKELLRSVSSLRKALNNVSYEIIIVDNSSPKKIPRSLSRHKTKIMVSDRNLGFGGGCNLGATKANGKYILFANPDTIFNERFIEPLLLEIKKMRVGIVGPKMVRIDGGTLPTTSNFITPFNAFLKYTFLGRFFNGNVVSAGATDVVSGACFLIRRTVFSKINGFDERFFMYFEEQDICKRVAKVGYKTIYAPDSVVTHLVGRSLDDKTKIRSYFERSRYMYFKKHFGVLVAFLLESLLRILTPLNLAAFFIFLSSVFINTYKLSEYMLFIGDAARDYIFARDMILGKGFELVGIPSSVTWLHQGPISLWLVALSLLIADFNPVAPAILFGVIGAVTTVMLFYLGSKLFGKYVGFFGSVLFAFSPIAVVNARMPYHTSLIPFFAVLFFIILYKTYRKIELLPVLTFTFGLLLLVELSNVVIAFVALIVLWRLRAKITLRNLILSALTFLLGILPFIIYDFLNGPTYAKFPLWIVNRLRVVFLSDKHEPTFSFFSTYYQQFGAQIFPGFAFLSILILVVSFILFTYHYLNKRRIEYVMVGTWILIPTILFALHNAPGTAYFPLLYPACSLVVAFFVYKIFKEKLGVVVVITIAIMNVILLIESNFYVNTKDSFNPMPPLGYSFGESWKIPNESAQAVLRDASGLPFQISASKDLLYETSIYPYQYLVWYYGGKIEVKSRLKYEVYPGSIKGSKNIIYRSNFDSIVRYD